MQQQVRARLQLTVEILCHQKGPGRECRKVFAVAVLRFTKCLLATIPLSWDVVSLPRFPEYRDHERKHQGRGCSTITVHTLEANFGRNSRFDHGGWVQSHNVFLLEERLGWTADLDRRTMFTVRDNKGDAASSIHLFWLNWKKIFGGASDVESDCVFCALAWLFFPFDVSFD